jgi:hypothetical protein
MEYIKVNFDPKDPRDVIANGNAVGRTDDVTIMLPLDFYQISLSGGGYTPASWSGNVANTTPGTPVPITFTKIAGASSAGV